MHGSYNWLRSRIKTVCASVGTSHSLRRGGASAMCNADISPIDVRNLGDWKSMPMLLYLTRTMESKVELDKRIVQQLFSET